MSLCNIISNFVLSPVVMPLWFANITIHNKLLQGLVDYFIMSVCFSRQMQVRARESSSDKVGMNDATEETHSTGLQAGKSSSSHPSDDSSETTKVKLKACKIVLTDLFVSHTHSAVCVGTKNGSVGGDGDGVKAGVRLQKTGDVKLEEMDVEKTGGHSEEQLQDSGLPSLTKEVCLNCSLCCLYCGV